VLQEESQKQRLEHTDPQEVQELQKFSSARGFWRHPEHLLRLCLIQRPWCSSVGICPKVHRATSPLAVVELGSWETDLEHLTGGDKTELTWSALYLLAFLQSFWVSSEFEVLFSTWPSSRDGGHCKHALGLSD